MGLWSLTFTGALWSLASALAIAVLGILTLRGGASRPRGALPFGLFCLVWGFEITVANLAGLTTSVSTASTLYLLMLAGFTPLPYFLTEFACSQSDQPRSAPLWTLMRWGAVAFGGLGAILLVLFPETLFVGTTSMEGVLYANWGSLTPIVIFLPFFGALGVALFATHRAMRRAPTERVRTRAGTIVAGLGLYVAFAAGNNLAFYAGSAFGGMTAEDALFATLFLVLTIAALGMGVRALLRAREAPTEGERRRELLIGAALLAPLLWGVVEGVLVLTTVPSLDTVGLWRFGGVAVLSYGLARRRHFDLPERLHRAASSATGVAGAVAGGAAVFGLGSMVFSGVAVPVAAGALLALSATVPGVRVAQRVLGPEGRRNPIGYKEAIYEHRIDAYRAAVEASLARDTLEEDEPFLADLRERYDVSDKEDRLVRYYARKSVVVARDGTVTDSYERVRILGEGGGGRTWLARDRRRDRLVVLKEPLAHWHREPRIAESLFEEARIATKVRHPNVVRVEEVLEDDGRPVLVMEHLERGSLTDLLEAEGVLDWRDAVARVHDLLSGLQAVHEAGILHRDVKPSNVLFGQDGRAKLADFGIALPEASSGKTRVHEDGPVGVGTEGYMAPEVANGEIRGSVRADVYGAAAVLHECLRGSPPVGEAAVYVDNDVPAEIEEILAKGLAKDPSRRFPTAEAFADALEEAVEP